MIEFIIITGLAIMGLFVIAVVGILGFSILIGYLNVKMAQENEMAKDMPEIEFPWWANILIYAVGILFVGLIIQVLKLF